MDLTEEKLYLTPFPVSPLFHLLMVSLMHQLHTPVTKKRFRAEYDYIIVGAGSAGSVLASRLSELHCVNVLLLEAGKSPPILTEIPSVGSSFPQTDLDWNFMTVPQRHTGSSLSNRQLPFASGKTLGGSSTINGMISNRGNRKNYDEWAALGATGWSYDEVLPYFLKLEDNQDQEFLRNGFHAVSGPVTIAKPNYEPDVKRAIIEAAKEKQLKLVDPNAFTQNGLYDFQATIRKGQRCSTAKAYLVPSENRTNLDIIAKATVTQVLIENKRAVGIVFDYGGTKHRVKATKEVILSAGAINTPKLLMLSGIGPMSELQRLQIALQKDLPVGQNLQDHIAGFIAFETDDSIEPFHKRLFKEENIKKYIEKREGPLVSPLGVNLLAFLSNNASGVESDTPDHELYFLEVPPLFAKFRIGFTPEVYRQVFAPYEDKNVVVCLSQVLHPKSRGTVRLLSSNINDPPEIDPKYFDDPHDIKDVVEGLKTCIDILSRTPMALVGAKIFNTTFPGCERYVNDVDLMLTCSVRAAVLSLSHQCCTAKMGSYDDPSAVVDPQLRVKGIQGLRVVDASVMPTIPWGNTNIPTIMIAEKASDIIKKTISCNVEETYVVPPKV